MYQPYRFGNSYLNWYIESTDFFSKNSSTYSRYFYKCEKYCDEIDPFSLPKIFCQDDFPVGLNYLDIMKYVIDGDSRYTENTFKSYRSLDAYKFYQAGWVHEVFAKQTSIGYIIVGSVTKKKW